jgi:hypothetical protein
MDEKQMNDINRTLQDGRRDANDQCGIPQRGTSLAGWLRSRNRSWLAAVRHRAVSLQQGLNLVA